MDVIIFGPWVGEFSYELSWWNPEIRKVYNDNYLNYYSIMVGYKGRFAMYKDFINKYISFPKELEDFIKFPATYGCHIKGRDIIPPEINTFFNYQIESIKKDKVNKIHIHRPGTIPITKKRCLSHNPDGDYINYTVNDVINKKIKNQINFNNDRETITLLARLRYRKPNVPDYLDWNPKNWELFLDKLINNLKVNVVLIGIERKNNRGGAIDFTDTDVYKKNKKYIMIMNFDDDDNSLEKQLALLKNTKCSIYGATGAACLPFFVNTPTFTQQTKEEGFRLLLNWEKQLTNGHNNVKVFDKYKNTKLYNSSVDELYQEFINFYRSIK